MIPVFSTDCLARLHLIVNMVGFKSTILLAQATLTKFWVTYKPQEFISHTSGGWTVQNQGV